MRMARLAAGDFKLAYVAPERLGFPGFRALVRELDCPLVAVDEAHCISAWGHDFRPEYLEIGGLLGELPRARVLACTATATPVVRDEILARLNLPADTPQLVRGFARPNLGLRAWRRIMRASAAVRGRVLARRSGARGGTGTAIVYAAHAQVGEEEGPARRPGGVPSVSRGPAPAERDRPAALRAGGARS